MFISWTKALKSSFEFVTLLSNGYFNGKILRSARKRPTLRRTGGGGAISYGEFEWDVFRNTPYFKENEVEKFSGTNSMHFF